MVAFTKFGDDVANWFGCKTERQHIIFWSVLGGTMFLLVIAFKIWTIFVMERILPSQRKPLPMVFGFGMMCMFILYVYIKIIDMCIAQKNRVHYYPSLRNFKKLLHIVYDFVNCP